MRLIDVDAMNEELFYEEMGGKDTLITCETVFEMIKAQPIVFNCNEVIDKLGHYENLDEQGLLLRLPCKVGDSIYSVVEDGLTILELKFSLDFYARRKNDIGKTVFLTQAEAEQKLKEMESDSNG